MQAIFLSPRLWPDIIGCVVIRLFSLLDTIVSDFQQKTLPSKITNLLDRQQKIISFILRNSSRGLISLLMRIVHSKPQIQTITSGLSGSSPSSTSTILYIAKTDW